ncbi:MAG: proline dehydrogenase family protein [Actinomycetales bacterium]|nr:proline dehydrogenase family protein [Actinomycetales bacterium]
MSSSLLRSAILAASRSESLRDAVTAAPVTRDVVKRFVAGTGVDDVVEVTRALREQGLLATVDRLGEDVHTAADADATVADYVELLRRLAQAGLTDSVEVSVKLSAVGQALPDGQQGSLQRARTICEVAAEAGTTVTLDMEDHTTTDATLETARELRRDFPSVAVVLQAYLRRTPEDVRAMAYAGSRIRLCKGAYKEPADVAFTDRGEIDIAYVRLMRSLIGSEATALLATHDPRLIDIATSLLTEAGRARQTYEFQMLLGIRPEEQVRLAGEGHQVRIYVPYGTDWWGYLMRRMAEKPANLALFTRSLLSRA